MAAPLPKAFWPVTITAGVNDALDYFCTALGGARAVTLTPATYYSAQELANAAALAIITNGLSVHPVVYPGTSSLVPNSLAGVGLSGITITLNGATAPDGTSTVDLFKEDTSNSEHFTYHVATPTPAASRSWTFEANISPGAGTARWVVLRLAWWTQQGAWYEDSRVWFNPATGAIGSFAGSGTILASSRKAGAAGYGYRFGVTITFSTPRSLYAASLSLATADGVVTYLGDGIASLGAWGLIAAPGIGPFGFAPPSAPTGPGGRITLRADSVWKPSLNSRAAQSAWPLLGGPTDYGVVLNEAAGWQSLFQHQNGWYGVDPAIDDTDDLPLYERAQSVALGGQSYGLDFGTRRQRLFTLGFLPAHKAWKVSELNANQNQAIERLFDSGWQRFRWWPDASAEGTSEDLVLDLDTAKAMLRDRLSPGNPLYGLKLRAWKFMP